MCACLCVCVFKEHKIKREGMLLSVLRETCSRAHRENQLEVQ